MPELKAIILVICCTFFTAMGQILWKIGSAKLSLNILTLITNLPLILGFLSYGIGLILLIVALKFGELSLLYPFIALSFIWVAIASMIFLQESMSILKWVAIIIIMIGVSFIGFGEKLKNGN